MPPFVYQPVDYSANQPIPGILERKGAVYADAIRQAAQARAQGMIGAANAWGQGISGMGEAIAGIPDAQAKQQELKLKAQQVGLQTQALQSKLDEAKQKTAARTALSDAIRSSMTTDETGHQTVDDNAVFTKMMAAPGNFGPEAMDYRDAATQYGEKANDLARSKFNLTKDTLNFFGTLAEDADTPEKASGAVKVAASRGLIQPNDAHDMLDKIDAGQWPQEREKWRIFSPAYQQRRAEYNKLQKLGPDQTLMYAPGSEGDIEQRQRWAAGGGTAEAPSAAGGADQETDQGGGGGGVGVSPSDLSPSAAAGGVGVRPSSLAPGKAQRTPGALESLVRSAADAHGIPPDLFAGLTSVESAFNPRARSNKGAIGLTQLMPDTARQLGVNPYDIAQNIAGGASYLKQMHRMFGDWDTALAAYNTGPGTVQRHGITAAGRDYINKVRGAEQRLAIGAGPAAAAAAPAEAATAEEAAPDQAAATPESVVPPPAAPAAIPAPPGPQVGPQPGGGFIVAAGRPKAPAGEKSQHVPLTLPIGPNGEPKEVMGDYIPGVGGQPGRYFYNGKDVTGVATKWLDPYQEATRKAQAMLQPTEQDIRSIADGVRLHLLAPDKVGGGMGGALIKAKVQALIRQTDPAWSFEKAQIEYDFAHSTNFQQTVRLMDAVTHSVPRLEENIATLSNGKFRTLNSVINASKNEFNNPQIAAFRTDAKLIGDEVGKIMTGSGGAVSDIKLIQAQELFKDSDDVPAMARTLKEVLWLIGNRRAALTKGTPYEGTGLEETTTGGGGPAPGEAVYERDASGRLRLKK